MGRASTYKSETQTCDSGVCDTAEKEMSYAPSVRVRLISL